MKKRFKYLLQRLLQAFFYCWFYLPAYISTSLQPLQQQLSIIPNRNCGNMLLMTRRSLPQRLSNIRALNLM